MSKIGAYVIEQQEGQPEPRTPDPDYEFYQEVCDILKGKSDKVLTDEHEKAIRAVNKRMVG